MKQQVNRRNYRQTESGNALWFILLAVALLGALTAAVTRSSDTAEQSGDIERYRINASNMMRHSASVEAAVQNMLMRGLGENRISFDNTYTSGATYTNPNCPAPETECLVYHGAGGGVNYKQLPSALFDAIHNGQATFTEWEFSGSNNVDGVGTSAPDLVMFTGYLERNLCRQINALLKIPEVSGDVPADSDGFDDTPYTGNFPSIAADTLDNMTGYETGCFNDSGAGGRDYTYYHVLIKR